jgi:hypothetical protein
MKLCPKCFSLIEKEEVGCDQMFCILCKTVFSWKTGLIVDVATSAHNPDYYQWVHRTGELSRNELDDPREGKFYIKCETCFVDQKISLVQICKTFGSPSVIEVDKTDFLLNFHKMFTDTLLEVSTHLDREADIRYIFLLNYISNAISHTLWKKYMKKHFYFIKQCEAIKYIIIQTLDKLYKLVLSENFNDIDIEKLCLCAVQQTDNILIH